MDTNYIIETKNLTKQYGSQKSVADLNIHVKRGRIYGLLGRNGAGKTTTMKMLLGLTKPTSGEVKIWGKPLQGNEKKLLPRIGSLIESPGFYPNLTGTENLRIFATLRGVPNNHAIKDALDLVGLPYKDKKLFSQYSLGMKQRLAIALAVMHDPELLILDEPINGLDPIGIAEVRYNFQQKKSGHAQKHDRFSQRSDYSTSFKSSSAEIPYNFASANRLDVLGSESPFSHFDTA